MVCKGSCDWSLSCKGPCDRSLCPCAYKYVQVVVWHRSYAYVYMYVGDHVTGLCVYVGDQVTGYCAYVQYHSI